MLYIIIMYVLYIIFKMYNSNQIICLICPFLSYIPSVWLSVILVGFGFAMCLILSSISWFVIICYSFRHLYFTIFTPKTHSIYFALFLLQKNILFSIVHSVLLSTLTIWNNYQIKIVVVLWFSPYFTIVFRIFVWIAIDCNIFGIIWENDGILNGKLMLGKI